MAEDGAPREARLPRINLLASGPGRRGLRLPRVEGRVVLVTLLAVLSWGIALGGLAELLGWRVEVFLGSR